MENVRFVIDYESYPDEYLDYLEQWDTPEKYSRAPVMVKTGNGDERRELTFDEYIESFGNPEYHTVYWARKECQCKCCGHWYIVDSLGGIDEYFGPYADGEQVTSGEYTYDELPEWVADHFTAEYQAAT